MTVRDPRSTTRSSWTTSPFSSLSVTVQRVLPISAVLAVQALAAAGLSVAVALGEPGWWGVMLSLVIAAGGLIVLDGLSLWRRVLLWTTFSWTRRRRTLRHDGGVMDCDPFDADLPGGSSIGVIWDGVTATALIRIEENPQAMTVMEPASTVSGEYVPLRPLADCLRQFDINLDAIDVISRGYRSDGRTHIAAVYDAMLGPLPAIAHRSVWVALRLDPATCAAAIRRRGGDWPGTVRTLATAARRVANRLADVGLRPRILSAAEINDATRQLTGGAAITAVEESWSACRTKQSEFRSHAVDATLFSSTGLGTLWTVPSSTTTVCVSLRQGGSPDRVQLRGVARFDGQSSRRKELHGLRDLRGRQYAALLASLPMPTPARMIRETMFRAQFATLDELRLPASGCGQVVGADERGRAVALSLFGRGVTRVEMCGTLRLAQQVVLRSLALGARVRVHTDRSPAWRAMVERVGEQYLLTVATQSGPAMRAGSAGHYSVEVFDGLDPLPVRAGVTTFVTRPADAVAAPGADVTLQLRDAERDIVLVSTPLGSATVTMVATDDEMRYLTPRLAVTNAR